MGKKTIQRKIPARLLDEIRTQIRENVKSGSSGWKSGKKNEDTLTGHLGAKIQTPWSEPVVLDGAQWRWRVEYHKFSSGGRYESEEKETGADGILQVNFQKFEVGATPIGESSFILEDIDLVDEFNKAILFQSKRFDFADRKKLVSELEKMEGLTPGESAYFEYGPQQYRAALGASVYQADGFVRKMKPDEFQPLQDFVADQFLLCEVGVEGMYYDFDEEVLIFPTSNTEIKKLKAAIKFGFRVRVKAISQVPFEQDVQR